MKHKKMFGKIKDIKRKLKYAKIAGIIFGIIFLAMLIATICQGYKIYQLEQKIEMLSK